MCKLCGTRGKAEGPTPQNRFFSGFLEKMGMWRNHFVTGRALSLSAPNIPNVCTHTPDFLLPGKSRVLERLWALNPLQRRTGRQ